MESLDTRLSIYMIGLLTALALIGLWASVVMPGLDRWSRRFFKALFTSLAITLFTCLFDIIVSANANTVPENMVAVEMVNWFIESVFISIPMPLLTIYLLHCSNERIEDSALFRVVAALWIAYIAMVAIGQFTGFSYYLTPDNHYVAGPGYAIVIAPTGIIMVLNLIAVLRRRNKFAKRSYHALLIYIVPLTIAIIVHMIAINYLLLEIAFTLFALSMFGIILQAQIEQYVHQQKEIAHQQASISVLQMRPHFIYNTMTSIYCLCDQDPKKAQQVTLDFTTYLRKNFTAIVCEDTIPFAEELEHTRAYLAVEQAQYEDMLLVDYDTPHVRFHVPPLTLQPVVENAVKHGMDPDAGPLHICVRTRETMGGNEVIVEDNGSGYEPTDDANPHVGLANIRQRLEGMCGGSMTILPRDGGGTKVRIVIPHHDRV